LIKHNHWKNPRPRHTTTFNFNIHSFPLGRTDTDNTSCYSLFKNWKWKYWGINQSHSRCVKLGIPNTLPVTLQSEIEHNKKSWHSQRSYRQTVKGQARMRLPKGEKHWLSRRRYSIKIKIIYLSKNSCLFQLPPHFDFGLPESESDFGLSTNIFLVKGPDQRGIVTVT